MVAGSNDNLQLWVVMRDIVEETVIEFLCGSRRVAVVEDISCHKQGISFLSLDDIFQPCHEMLVLRQSVDAVKQVADMPVTGSYYFHRGYTLLY